MRLTNKKVTLKDLDKLGDWKKDMLEMYRNGASDSEVRAMLRERRRAIAPKGVWMGFSVPTWERLVKDEPTFAAIVREGQDAAKGWWETKAREAAIGELKTNPANLIFALKNRAGYTDRQEIDHKGNEKPTFVVVQGKESVAIEATKTQPQTAHKPH